MRVVSCPGRTLMREKSVFRKGLMAAAALFALLTLPIDAPSAQTPRRAVGASLNPMLEPIRARFELPALAAAVVRNGKIVEIGRASCRERVEISGVGGTLEKKKKEMKIER